ncbi:hypothetical protein AYL99_11746 [Fonsecaea erecta]|uniref:Uncharacterized protein n=1 Tax=Fonsecaea erecta TaxID=1367422 RepID=A0A178Z3T9_9EURO|nr:hypothetical protein AYL99_11746 [Fonsecaea erecta]OAP54211.1 hypothetical protein AYL99_11746 [Fonsecaea erecta]
MEDPHGSITLTQTRGSSRLEKERKYREMRENQFNEWLAGRRQQRLALLAKIKEQTKQKADSRNHKGIASQMRMKTLANLTSDRPKRKRRGGDDYDDDFGANDDDWGVYRTVATEPTSDDEEPEEDPVSALKALESELLQCDRKSRKRTLLRHRTTGQRAFCTLSYEGQG